MEQFVKNLRTRLQRSEPAQEVDQTDAADQPETGQIEEEGGSKFSLSRFGINVTPPSATATITIEHGFIKLLIVDNMEIVDHRIALANPQFFREGMASDSRRMSEVLTRNMEDTAIDYGQLVGAVPGYQTSLR